MPKLSQPFTDDSLVPAARIRTLTDHRVRDDGEFVLYWMIAFRRTHWNFSLQRAVEWASDLRKPLIVLEALRCDYKWASDRLHGFVIQGMADNQLALADRPALYYPYLERSRGEGSGLLQALAEQAAVIITDDFPAFFLPRMLELAARNVEVRMEAVDSNGLYPMHATDKVFARAFDFRRHLQKELPQHLLQLPQADPFEGRRLPTLAALPTAITKQWPTTDVSGIAKDSKQLSKFPIDHNVKLVPSIPGGEQAAMRCLDEFLTKRLPRYGDERSDPDADAASGFSPYLHFGHLSTQQVFVEVAHKVQWSPAKLSSQATGSREGWWGVDSSTESFLDELVTWRELGFNLCSHHPDYARYSSLPDWARTTLARHAGDERKFTYTLAEFEAAKTHDELWNAAQRQLLVEGRIHNYLRMLWGKKILEWSPTPQDALDVMIELNNKYALDGRNPNSYSGIFWVLGRYDRAWGPERPIYGKIRYMSSKNTARKLNVKGYLKRYSTTGAEQGNLF